MHADGAHQHSGEAETAKPRCHSASHEPATDEYRFAKPPCGSSITFAGTLLPPFDLLDLIEIRLVLRDLGATAAVDELPLCAERAPDTPPPILAV